MSKNRKRTRKHATTLAVIRDVAARRLLSLNTPKKPHLTGAIPAPEKPIFDYGPQVRHKPSSKSRTAGVSHHPHRRVRAVVSTMNYHVLAQLHNGVSPDLYAKPGGRWKVGDNTFDDALIARAVAYHTKQGMLDNQLPFVS